MTDLATELLDAMAGVARLLDEVHGVGTDQVTWHGRDDSGRTLPSGAYYVRLEGPGMVDTRKVMLLK